LPWEEPDDSDGDLPAAWAAAAGLDDGGAEIQWVRALIDFAHGARGRASKILCLARLIRRVREPMVVFTEFRDTLEAAHEALAPLARVDVIHGGLDPAARQAAEARFTHGDTDVLLATDAAGEGLNLHHRSRLVVTIEWPWSALRLEQRIGRVDRLGQRRRVHAIHLFHRGTFEDTVLANLMRRRDRAAEALDEVTPESTIAAAIFDPTSLPAPRTPHPAPRTPHSAPRTPHPAPRTPHPAPRTPHSAPRTVDPSWCPPRHATRTLAVLVEVTRTSPYGCIVDGRVVPLAIELHSPPATRRDWQSVVDRLVRDPQVLDAAVAAGTSPLHDWSSVVRRITSLRRQSNGRTPLVQAALFDQRTVRAAEAHRETRRRIDDHLTRRVEQMRVSDDRLETRARVLIAWPLGPHRRAR
jgi:hypothetical protein